MFARVWKSVPTWACVAAVVAVIVILYLAVNAVSNRAADAPLRDYRASNGTMDEPATRALGRLAARTDPRPRDRFIRADLRLHNLMHDDNIALTGRQQTELVDAVADDYAAILQALAVEDGPDADMIGTDFMLHQIMAFEREYRNPVVAAGVAAHAPAAVTRTIDERVAVAADANTRGEAVDAYFGASIVHTSDPQNVHDSGVNSDLRRTLDRIRHYEHDSRPLEPNAAIEAAQSYINRHYDASTARKQAALAVLGRVREGNRIDTYNDREDRIFASVWSRARSDMNRGHRDDAATAVCDALADAFENGSPVCINGRTSRVLNSLATIDTDATISAAAMTSEAYRNQIFRETQKIIGDAADRAAASGDQAMAAVGRSFSSEPGAAVDADAERQFVGGVKAQIDDNLAQYADRFSPAEVEKLRAECYAGVEV